MQKFQNMVHSNSWTFKGLEFFFQNSRTSQGHYEPWSSTVDFCNVIFYGVSSQVTRWL